MFRRNCHELEAASKNQAHWWEASNPPEAGSTRQYRLENGRTPRNRLKGRRRPPSSSSGAWESTRQTSEIEKRISNFEQGMFNQEGTLALDIQYSLFDVRHLAGFRNSAPQFGISR